MRFGSERLAGLLVGGLAAVLGLRLYRLTDHYSVNIFFYDQWGVTGMLLRPPDENLFFTQVGMWYFGLGGPLTEALYTATRWNTRAEGFASFWLLMLAMTCVVALKVRLFGRLTVSDAIIPIVFTTPTQYETFVGIPFLSHSVLPVLLTPLYCVSWFPRQPAARYTGVVATNFLLTFTGNGFVVGAMTPVLLCVDLVRAVRDRSARYTLFFLALLLSVLTLLLWWWNIKYMAVLPCYKFPHEPVTDYALFIAHMFRMSLGLRGQTGWLAIIAGLLSVSVVLAICVYYLIRILRRRGPLPRQDWVILVFASYSLLFGVACAVGRVCGGVIIGESSRYMTFLILAFVAAYFSILQLPRAFTRWMLLAVYGGVLMFTVVPLGSADRVGIEFLRAWKQDWKDCYLRIEDVARCDQLTRPILPPEMHDDLHFRWQLQQFKERRLGPYANGESRQ